MRDIEKTLQETKAQLDSMGNSLEKTKNKMERIGEDLGVMLSAFGIQLGIPMAREIKASFDEKQRTEICERNGDQCPYSIQFCEREESEAFSRGDPDSDPQRSDAGAGHVLYHGRRF